MTLKKIAISKALKAGLLFGLILAPFFRSKGQMNEKPQIFTLADGRITLEVPAGAMAKGTQISLRESSARFPDSTSVLNSFELLPTGTTFKKPVNLIINYDDDFLKGNSPSNVGIAFSDDANNKWYAQLNGSIDTVKKTISLKITHFSHWSIFSCFHLYFKVNNKVYRDDGGTLPMLTEQRADLLMVMDLPPLSADDYMKKFLKNLGDKSKKEPIKPVSTPDCPDCALLGPVYYDPISFDHIQSRAIIPDEWRVNGIKNGDANTGRITNVINKNYRYTSPSQMPPNNPMAVTAVINTKSHGQIQIIRQVNVYARKWTLDYHKTYEDPCEGEDDFGYGYKAEMKYTLDFTLKDGFEMASVNYNPEPLQINSSSNCTVCESNVNLAIAPKTGIFLSNIKASLLPGNNNPFPFQVMIKGNAKIYAAFHASWRANVCGDDPFDSSSDVVLDDYHVDDFPLGWLPFVPGKTDIRLGGPDPHITATMESH